jgi:uncharacterized tellurite resistance protein B-like protein
VARSAIFADLDKKLLHKLAAAAALAGRIAITDGEVSQAERSAMAGIFGKTWNLSPEQADALVEIIAHRATTGMDFNHAAYEYFQLTEHSERVHFLHTLFQIAQVCGKTSYEESEEIRRVSHQLKLSHGDFIDAKLSVKSSAG